MSLFVPNAVGQDWWMWGQIGISLVVGILVGVLLWKCHKFGSGVAGAFLGYVVGNFLYELVMHKLDGHGTPVWYYVTIVLCAIIFGILAYFLHEGIYIIATTVGGSYIAVRMVGTMAGKCPDETFVAQEIAAGE